MEKIRRGQIYLVNLGKKNGSIQAGIRPVIVISNDINNKFSPTINVIPITSRLKNNLPIHVNIGVIEGLKYDSIVLVEQIVTMNKSELISLIGSCNRYKMLDIEKAMLLQNGIDLNYHLQVV